MGKANRKKKGSKGSCNKQHLGKEEISRINQTKAGNAEKGGKLLVATGNAVRFATGFEDGNGSRDSTTKSKSLGEEDTLLEYVTGLDSGSESIQNYLNKLKIDVEGKAFDKMTSKTRGSEKPRKCLYSDNRELGNGWELDFYDSSGYGVVLDDDDDVDEIFTTWGGYALVGYIAGKSQSPDKKTIIAYCNTWKVKYEIDFDATGWIVIKFENEAGRESVLEKGPFVISGLPLILKHMGSLFCFDENEIDLSVSAATT